MSKPKASASNTMEVFFVINKDSKKDKNKKTLRLKSPATKNLDSLAKKYRSGKGQQFASFCHTGCAPSSVIKNSESNPQVNLPVYQEYIKRVKKVDMSSKLKDLHRKMHFCIMNSFNEKKQKSNSKSKYHQKMAAKASSSFIFQAKSPLHKVNASSQNFILKNKKNLKNMINPDECQKKPKSKRFRRNLSKKSIGSSTHKTSGYSTSKNKGSFTTSYQKFKESSSVIKYRSFVNTAKVSPARIKSIERVPKKSQRKLDMNSRKVSCGKRKISSSKVKAKAQVSIASHCKNKSSFKKFTRNQFTTDALDADYGSLIDSYTEILSKRKDIKKPNKKEASKSFNTGSKKKSTHKRSFLGPNIHPSNRWLGKENIDINGKSFHCSTDGLKKPSVVRLHYRRNTAECNKKKSSSKLAKSKKATPFLKQPLHENYMTLNFVASSCKNFHNKKKPSVNQSEITSNESTPRIEDEDVIINTISGMYGETFKNSFCGKNINSLS
ncbi:unnamed protein product [Moneuplotes crassus]|uniref:Uncharacterized protein n=1 Tax=Euplotes crassus TaxID=5936 RepID=A0AAD2DB08_EUPCR|nr:unnamed protein product [Moneuplotes crassus]